ncbi:MAG: XRE family transcriptional regulator [Arcicella sp.]|jgi:Zn-dependent peptidase ImmA (M78 family)|nr:XRE family transcriptional regulator [Arcicella sp.]
MKENINITVNYKVLVWARETIVMTRTSASNKTGIPINRLVQLEEGERLPTLEEVKELSKAYKRTIATLLLNTPPKEKPLPKDRRTVNSSNVGNFHEKTIMAIRKARSLVSSLIELKQDAGIMIPRFQYKANLQDNPVMLANKLREELNLGEIRHYENINSALEAYIEKVESLGVAVFQLSLTQDSLRGFSIVDESMPIIGIKGGGEPPTAKTFTLFHEFAHIILNEGGLCDLSENTNQHIEKWCNAFAAEILVPTSELIRMDIVVDKYLKKDKIWSKNDLIKLGNHFHVGPLTILRRLLDNKRTTPQYYNNRHEAWNKPQFGRSKNPEGRNIAKETIKEKGKTYISLAFSAFDQNRIDIKDLSDFLGVNFSYINKTRQLLNT